MQAPALQEWVVVLNITGWDNPTIGDILYRRLGIVIATDGEDFVVEISTNKHTVKKENLIPIFFLPEALRSLHLNGIIKLNYEVILARALSAIVDAKKK